MALMHGRLANIYWDGDDTDTELQHGQSWSVDVTHDVAEITAMQDEWRSYQAGFQDWTGTVECLLDAAGADIPLGGDATDIGMADDTCYLELLVVYDTSDYKCLYGQAICTGVSLGVDKDGIPTVTYTFQGVGQMKWDSDTARVFAV